MELRSLIRGITALSILAASLLLLSLLKNYSERRAREHTSIFAPLVTNESLEVKDITKVEVALSDEQDWWTYERTDGLWRLPEFAGAFALNGEVDALVKMLIQGRMRPVGISPKEDAHFGLLPRHSLSLALFQGPLNVLRARIGALKPGASKDERYVLRDNDNVIYLLASDPAVFFNDVEPPAMLDKHILPRALPHGIPARISYAGSRPSELRELVIKELPVNREEMTPNEQGRDQKKQKKVPTHEFTGTLASGATKTFDDEAGMSYLNRTLDIEFDKIVGGVWAGQVDSRQFDNPVVQVTLSYNTNTAISLAVSGALLEDKYPILNRTTGQIFLITPEKVDALLPQLPEKSASQAVK